MPSATPLPLDHPLTQKTRQELQKSNSYVAQAVEWCSMMQDAGKECADLRDRADTIRQANENMLRVFFPGQ